LAPLKNHSCPCHGIREPAWSGCRADIPVPGGIGRTLAVVPPGALPVGLAAGAGALATTVGEAAVGAAVGRTLSVGVLASGGVPEPDDPPGGPAAPEAATGVDGVPVGSLESSDGVPEYALSHADRSAAVAALPAARLAYRSNERRLHRRSDDRFALISPLSGRIARW
jgi:hypothetical protein